MATSIIVDRQQQYNNAQINTHYYQTKIADALKKAPHKEKNYYLKHPLFSTFEESEIVPTGLSGRELTISKSVDSIGLQIADVYLWIANKLVSGQELPNELSYLWSLFGHRSSIDGISMKGMERRYTEFEKLLPRFEDLNDEQKQFSKSWNEKHREKVRSLAKGY